MWNKKIEINFSVYFPYRKKSSTKKLVTIFNNQNIKQSAKVSYILKQTHVSILQIRSHSDPLVGYTSRHKNMSILISLLFGLFNDKVIKT